MMLETQRQDGKYIMKNLKPKFIENSFLPVILSKVAPIEIWAISIGPFVWCRGRMSEETRRHETIHFQQQLELLFIFHWILYISFWIIGLFIFKSGKEAYKESPFEREARHNEHEEDYLKNRTRYSWIKYIFNSSKSK
jgi:hypothetical protein